ncbi:MAG TPA: 4-(cytidine 5'-diphospho)-2-C-methyl-D-erythritol kinase [Dehalococcoidia bacterium]|nr:4-(cytidine 5'-diphospho)-2-C-methyl-D-erythritol kinase [Dehalococcoidia bacterium]
MITTVVPAKINWTLEVLGRRDDGYHRVRTVMQTVDVCDEVSVEIAEGLTIARNTAYADDSGDLVARAAERMGGGAAISVTKRIPLASGLGGGSSGAAATLRALSQLRGESAAIGAAVRLADVAAGIGSDVAFFLHGGTALAEGRGERITPLPDVPAAWLVILVPAIRLEEKTKRMYAALSPNDYTDGSRADAFIAHVEAGWPLAEAPLYNAFERVAYETLEGLAFFREALLEAGAQSVQVCGAGPSLYCVASGEEEARAIRARVSRVRRGEKVYAVRNLGAAEATAVWAAA